MTAKRSLLMVSFVLVLTLALSSIVMANPEFRWRAGIGLNDQSAQYHSLEYFANLVEESLCQVVGGTGQVQNFPPTVSLRYSV